MIRITASRYSAVAATAALVISLGGTSYAVTQVGTAQLKNNAVTSPKIRDGQVTSADVRNNGLTGADIIEQKLARVPQAGTAYSAEYADDAGLVDGNTVKRIDASKAEGPGRDVVPFRSNDLEIELRCTGTGGVDLVATTAVGGGSISTLVVGDQSPGPGEAVENDLEDGTFATNLEFDLLAGGNGDLNQVSFVYDGAQSSVVTGTLQVNYASGLNEPCRVSGFITAYLPPQVN